MVGYGLQLPEVLLLPPLSCLSPVLFTLKDVEVLPKIQSGVLGARGSSSIVVMSVHIAVILPEGSGCFKAGQGCMLVFGVIIERNVYICTRYYYAFGLNAFCN